MCTQCVLVASAWATLAASAVGELATRELFGHVVVDHVHAKTSPSELVLHDEGLYAWQFGLSEDLLVGHSVLSCDLEDPVEAAKIKLFKTIDTIAITGRGLSALQQS